MYKEYHRVLHELDLLEVNYHIVPCEGFNQIVVYTESKEDCPDSFILLTRDDYTGDLEWFPDGDWFEYTKPYLYLQELQGEVHG